MSEEIIKLNRTTLAMLVTIVLFLAGQTVAAIVYGARIGVEVNALKESMSEIKQAANDGTRFRYTSQDASRDKEMMLQIISGINHRCDLSEKRIERLEDRGRTN
jgi:hypothetical protein